MVFRAVLLGAFLASGLIMSAGPAPAQTGSTLASEAARMDQMAATRGESKVIDKISADFSSFLGADARAVVSGLREGAPITLTTTTPGMPPATTTTTIVPPTGPMGHGNVFISLALAREQLAQAGITQPTPAELQAALLGGSITTGSGATATTTNFQGILTMRGDGMGWGQIAQQLGTKLGPVVSGLKSANHSLTVGSASTSGSGVVDAGGRAVGSTEGGIVSGGGKPLGNAGRGGVDRGAGQGIVSGSGRPFESPSGIVSGRGQAYGITGGGQGSDHGRGQFRERNK